MKKVLLIINIVLVSFTANAQNLLELSPSNFPVTYPCGLTEFNNKLFYVGVSTAYGRELFSTDGTAQGNQLVKDIGDQYYPQTNGFLMNDAVSSNGKFGTFNGKLYFEANNEFTMNNFKLWSTDGTAAGTNIIAPKTVYGQVRYFKEFNGRLYFTALGYDTGYEVWSTDGTTEGTVLLKDINPTPGESSVIMAGTEPHFTVFNNRLYFVANDGVHGNEIWSTDGTTDGTTMLIDLVEGAGSAFFADNNGWRYQNFVIFQNKMWFNAKGFVDFENEQDFLYSTDGTSAGTTKFQIPMPANSPSHYSTNHLINITGLTLANNKLYIAGKAFRAYNQGLNNYGVWQTDGTMANTTFLKVFSYIIGISGLNENEHKGSMREFNGEYYFLAEGVRSESTTELWKLNPISNIFTEIVSPTINVNSGKYLISQVFNNRLYFVLEGSIPGIYSTDGTGDSTVISARSSAPNNQSQHANLATMAMTFLPHQLKTVGNSMYFAAGFNNETPSLWRITNSTSGIEAVVNNNPTIKIFPNPTTNNINLAFNNKVENANLKIIALTGQTVLEKQHLSGTDFRFDVSNLFNGIYIVKITNNQEMKEMKFIKN